LVVPELLSSRTRVLLSAMETCPGCPAVTTSERQPALAGEGRGEGRGERRGDGRRDGRRVGVSRCTGEV